MTDLTGIRRIVGPTILLRSGGYFDFELPESSPITIDDIATGLSHLCRFTGQCHSFYSVAEHSILCSQLVPPQDALAALIHPPACPDHYAEGYTAAMEQGVTDALEYWLDEELGWGR